MALMSCRECGHQVSDTSMACVSCGAPVTSIPHLDYQPLPKKKQVGLSALVAVS